MTDSLSSKNDIQRLKSDARKWERAYDHDHALVEVLTAERDRLRAAVKEFVRLRKVAVESAVIPSTWWNDSERAYAEAQCLLNGDGRSDETAAKPVPCWCPYCGEPHGVRRAETDPRGTECQHDRFKPKFTLQWVGSTPDIRANTHRFQCRICCETFDLAIGEAQLGSAENGEDDPCK